MARLAPLLLVIALMICTVGGSKTATAQTANVMFATTAATEMRPALGANTLVWQEEIGVIKGFDFTLNQPLSTSIVTAGSGRMITDLSMDGNRIAWVEEEMGGSRIVHILTKTIGESAAVEVGASPWKVNGIDVSGSRVVWDTNTGTENIINFGTTAGGTPIEVARYGCIAFQCSTAQPHISGARMVYRKGDGSIWLHDFAQGTGRMLAASPTCSPNGPADIDGNLVVWEDFRTCQSGDIYGMDVTIGTETVIANGPVNQQAPRVSGNTIVWIEQTVPPSVYTATWGVVGTRLVSNAAANAVSDGTNHMLATDGTRVVWTDRRAGNLDIYGAQLIVAPPPPVTEIDYFALGDSVASGHGLMDDTKDGGDPIGCRRSNQAYPYKVVDLMAQRLVAAKLTKAYHFACSGAVATRPYGERYKWLGYQVQDALKILADPARPRGRKALVSITIGANDFGWSDLNAFGKHLAEPLSRYQSWANGTAKGVKNALKTDVHLLLSHPDVSVVITQYYNPLNQASVVYLKAYPYEGMIVDATKYYTRTEYLVNRLNIELANVKKELRNPARLIIAPIKDKFRGHESAKPSCGLWSPERNQTWIQHPQDPLGISNSLPLGIPQFLVNLSGGPWSGDCFHPNDLGAWAIAEEVDAAARKLNR